MGLGDFPSKPTNVQMALAHAEVCAKATSGWQLDPDLYICDTGASCCMGHCDKGVVNVKIIKEPITVGSGHVVYATKIGRKLVTIIQKDGSRMETELSTFKYVPKSWGTISLLP